MVKRLTPIERFISDIPSDRRRAYDARMLQRGFTRVTVTVPSEYVDALKAFSRVLRNHHPDDVEHFKKDFSDYLADTYRAYDEDVSAGRYTDEGGFSA